MDFTYQRETTASFQETIEALERVACSLGLNIVARHDVQAALVAKGFETRPVVVVEFAVEASAAPFCGVTVATREGSVVVSVTRPSVLWQVTGGRVGAHQPLWEALAMTLVDTVCPGVSVS